MLTTNLGSALMSAHTMALHMSMMLCWGRAQWKAHEGSSLPQVRHIG